MSDLKQQFESLSMELSKAQTDMNDLVQARSKLETQYQENKIVLEEFDHMNEESKIYKLTGPVLMPQDYSEAKMNVTKRMEFIQQEIKRVEDKLAKTQEQMEAKRDQLIQVRGQIAT